MVSYLTRIVGLARLDLAEDIVQDALCRAMETWSIEGLHDNPSAWLMRVARNRAIDLVRQHDQFRYILPELTHLMKRRESSNETPAFDEEIRDDHLRMMFSCCHPELSTEAQITLILKTLCGFSVSEIAHAFLAAQDSIEKRLGRAQAFPRFRSVRRSRRRRRHHTAPRRRLPSHLLAIQRGLPRQPFGAQSARRSLL